MSLVCPGEYITVWERSMNKERLFAAHQTPADHALAYALVAHMHDLHGQEYSYGKGQPPRLQFRRAQRGYKRSWARTDRENGTKSLCLPHEDLIYKPGLHRSCYGHLRVGVVVHEFAHLLTVSEVSDHHGPKFTIVLDQLLYETKPLWEHLTPRVTWPVLRAAGR